VSEARVLELDDARWRAFVELANGALPFHHPAWAQLVADCYGLKAFAFALCDGGDVIAGVPMIEVGRMHPRWIALPFTDRCPPLAGGEQLGELATALDEERRTRSLARVEVRSPLGGLPATFPIQTAAVLHRRRLDGDTDALFRSLPASVRRNVQAAMRHGVTVRRAETGEDLTRTFYALHVETRRRQGLPVQPRRFFEALWDRMIEPGLGSLLLAFLGPTPVAGAVFLAWRGGVTYKYGASRTAFWRLRPNDLIFWTALSSAAQDRCTDFDLGRTDADNAGLRRFKSSWATEERLVYSSVGAPVAAPSFRPPRLAAAVIRHSPPWVARLTGELFYRFAA
jgi:CelD/BcsL family acetyltransferase involved in cellulose biosynthesis